MIQLPKTYEYNEIEERIYNFWLENELFRANPENVLEKGKSPFSIMMPPPNITGRIHMGHLLNNTIQDILARYYRMIGYEVLWQPGTDHAGIATQNVVERELLKEGKTRHEIGKEEFIKRIWKWKEDYGSIIINQLKKLGISADWSRIKFTMDEDYYNAVIYAFKRLYESGLIYKGLYIVNWCPRCYTTLSNDEVEDKEINGKLYYIRYPVLNSSEYIVVATTRPETYLGDIAIAINPNDTRYKHFVGKKVKLPLVEWQRFDYFRNHVENEIEIMEDEFVDMEFGTGAVKITPAHDKDDFEIGKKYKLPMVLIMNYDGRLNENAGIFKNLDRFKAREEIVKKLAENGFIEKIESYKYNVGVCYRCETIVEPIISEQWFLKLSAFKDIAKKVVEDNIIEIIPEYGKKIYFNWWDNIKDWAISRQIWWGHKIPLENEEDVLDTWFSSALWPIATLGWPNEAKEMKAFFPTSVLITGWDILFFWVARMIVMSLFFKNEVPFKKVYLHGLVRDEKGRKMSKSLGNSPEPLELFEKYSVDGVRIGLMLITPEGQDVRFSEKYMEVGRNYANKIWNIARFLFLNFEDKYEPLKVLKIEDKWIISEFNKLIKEVKSGIESFEFNNTAKLLYDFTWHKFADWYIEATKTREDKTYAISNAIFIFQNILKLHHPYMPFITEELYQKFPLKKKLSIMQEEFPDIIELDNLDEDAKKFEFIKKIIDEIREIKGLFKVQTLRDLKLYVHIYETSQENRKIIEENFRILKLLGGIKELQETNEKLKNYGIVALEGFLGFLEFPNIDFEKERERLINELEKIIKIHKSINDKLNNQEFLNKAPKDVIENQKNKLLELEDKINKLKKILY
ncbi:MAG: valine--tRNA ligase [candidate division WOR-3 bacterium]|nr:valine--tRNA ligase [candidate division WOR-3 bacterium]MCX7947970.1 valine--tRNA ligase [candidate division WOR-3 bacterium]MDW8150914.1 valine--tRNA ligase [candidate division WOR-3 bacterium]